ncbi:MAG TPA: PEP-CTERM sorting domain-containing protein [Rhizomicrobium sp.]|nr:PEP-CTERM sorting domain-containing protein [Rhizomicrobium sp.]
MLKRLAGAVILALIASPASALPINNPVPTNAYISYAGLDWAWGGPCAYRNGCGDGDLSYQSTLGWRLPTESELALVTPNFASLFVFAGANVPLNGSDPLSGATVGLAPGAIACASPYFSTTHSHCDYENGMDGLWAGPMSSNVIPYAEQLYVRATTGAPEPTTLALLGAGLAGLSFRRKTRA